MYKVLVTTCYDRAGGSDRGCSVHTLVPEFPDRRAAETAAEILNRRPPTGVDHRTAECLF